MEFENRTSTWARTRLRSPVAIGSSTALLMFSTPASAMTVGVPFETIRASRAAAVKISHVVAGRCLSATFHARMRLEKLSMTA
jgi:hypothetical protein